MRHTLIYIGALLLLSITAAATAQEPPKLEFFSVLQDTPIMPGLKELPEQTIIFDKPEGRIIESVAVIESGNKEGIQRYYETILPQFGWSKISNDSFARKTELLKISFENHQNQNFFHIVVVPR